jgi:tetratricopeptide (TPR) repeat protein
MLVHFSMMWRTAQIELSLRQRTRSLIFLIGVGAACLLLAAETSLSGLASSFDTPAHGRWLMAVDAYDPQLEYQLAQLYKGIDPAERMKHLRRAAELSPYNRFYWSRLASACESLNDVECAGQARKRLVNLSPMVPSYHFDVAEIDLKEHHLDEALVEFRQLFSLDPTFAPAVWPTLQPVLGPDLVFQKLLAGNANAQIKIGYVDFLSEQGDNDAAYRVWNLAVGNRVPFPFSSAKPYLERLMANQRIREAESVWQDLEGLGVVKQSDVDKSENLLFNGGFEQFPLNAGFDWRWPDQLNYLSLEFSATGAYRGLHCLQVDFTVKRNDEYEPVYQVVPVLPNHAYRLEAYVRSENITSDTGPSLRVSDTKQPGFEDATSETTVGTTFWHPVRLDFSTGAETQAVRVSIWRARGRTFPTEISGTFWLDAVLLKDMGSAMEKTSEDGQR